MNLKFYTDVALRVMLYLGQHPGRRSSIAEIVSDYGLSRSHVTKVVHDLASAGFIASARGYQGGIWLSKSPRDINVGALIRHAEDHWALVDCAGCALAAQCGFNPILAEALRAFLAVLDSYTLADVLEHEGGRTALLGGLYGGSGACPQ